MNNVYDLSVLFLGIVGERASFYRPKCAKVIKPLFVSKYRIIFSVTTLLPIIFDNLLILAK